MAESTFDLQKFISESQATLLSPANYFSSMEKEGGFVEPIIKAAIYSLLSGIISFIWGALNISYGTAAFGSIFGGTMGVSVIIGSLIWGVIALFIGGVILLIISAICGGNTNYEANVRVSAAMAVLYPVNSLLGFTYALSFKLAAIVYIAVAIYGLYMLYFALTKALGGKEGTAKIISIILGAIPVLMIVSSLLCVKGIENFSGRSLEQMSKEMSTEQKDFNKMLEQANKALQEEMKKQEAEKDSK